jgi:hypothetical protein
MMHIKTLAPNLLGALKAVELGCRKIQNDPNFIPDMQEWMTIINEEVNEKICLGCLATITLMQLTNKSGADIVNCFDPESFPADKSIFERGFAFNLHVPIYNFSESEVALFEKAINCLRQGDLSQLLRFYGLDTHTNADPSIEWLDRYDNPTLGFGTTKEDLLVYADFIRDELIPKIIFWFADLS